MHFADYDAAEEMGMSGQGLQGFGEDAPNWYDKYIAPLVSSAGQIAAAKAQVQAINQQAKTGIVPSANVNVGITPDVQKILLYGGLALAGVLVLNTFMKKGRR